MSHHDLTDAESRNRLPTLFEVLSRRTLARSTSSRWMYLNTCYCADTMCVNSAVPYSSRLPIWKEPIANDLLPF
ncbi:Regulator of G protein signaling superfamily [Penicillium expansum]|nr:Regulator of G protein signaling superfamily [Penicillium expansum]